MAERVRNSRPMREYFHVPENYFLSHSVGCLPKASSAALTAGFLGPWMSGTNWDLWMNELETFRTGMAEILNVQKASVCPQVNVSSALTKILFSLPKPEARDVILLSKQDFPTIGFVAKQAERLGYRLKFVEGNPADFRHWNEAIDARVAFVLITHALSNSSHLLPVGEICSAAMRVGALSIVDVAQSLGAVPVNLRHWDPDFVIGTGVKFLCFGPGACFLYVAEHMMSKCQPFDVGWFSHENPFEMDIDNFRYARDAMRFFGGTPSPAPYFLANSALKYWKDIGLGAAHIQIQSYLTRLHECLPEGAAVSPDKADARGATLVVKNNYADKIREHLIEADIRFDQRRDGFRFSVHGYTQESEVDQLGDILSFIETICSNKCD